MLHDLRSALRWIARRPGLTSLSVASLALGIGANVAVFSVIDAVLFRPFPVSEPERLLFESPSPCCLIGRCLGAPWPAGWDCMITG